MISGISAPEHAPMATPSRAVFLSYASEDAPAAQRIAEALRATGIDVWFDQSELRGGDAWDRKIRREIHDCALFMPVISAHSDARHEGYFRREWRLAVERAGDMAEDVPFLLPVVIDATKDARARVPDRFREVQWSHLPDGRPSDVFVERVRRLLTPETAPAVLSSAAAARGLPTSGHRARRWTRAWFVTAAVAAAVAIGYFGFERLAPKRAVSSVVAPVSAPSLVTAGFNPPPHSIAVLPFVNMSGDKEQEYFSEGLTEELLNSLSRINELQVAARTSSFSFASEHPDIATVAHKLNVGAVLEGSVRRSAHTLRITAQLINGITGYHLWSQTYDRDLGDVLKLQTEIATAVASALKVTLLGDEAAKIELGGTSNPAALDAYLRASKVYFASRNGKDVESAIDSYTDAIRLDPNYALGYAGRSLALAYFAGWASTRPLVRARIDNAQADAHKAIDLAPDLAEGHLALAGVYEDLLEFTSASKEFERARTLAPGNSRILRTYGTFAIHMGQAESGLAALRRAVVLDPLNPITHGRLGEGLMLERRYAEATTVIKDVLALDSDIPVANAYLGITYYLLGDFQAARSSCERDAEEYDVAQYCLAMTYDKLGRHPDAEAMLAKSRASNGDTGAVWYAMAYAQWGATAQALDWLETAMRLREPDLKQLKSPLLDPLRNEPRFQAIERALKFPD